MADKEATVYIVDVGLSMGRKHNGRKQSDLDWAMEYVWDKITSTVCQFPITHPYELLMNAGRVGAQNSDARSDRATYHRYVLSTHDFNDAYL